MRIVPAVQLAGSTSDLFTYDAALKVVDADTLWVKEKQRLRDLDCPVLATREGKATPW